MTVEPNEDLTIEKQDYAKILFELSRARNIDRDTETEFTCICERAWCGDVAQYIVELENKLAITEQQLDMMKEDINAKRRDNV